MLVLLLLASVVQVSTPKTVNGQELGGVEQFQNEGAARICLENTSIDLVAGEAATLQYAGIHSGTVRVTSKGGFVDVRHGDSWAPPEGRRERISSRDGSSIERFKRGDEFEYVAYAATEYSDGELTPILRMSGTALTGNERDIAFLDRVNLYSTQPEACLRQYHFGWDMLFGDEPVSISEKQ